MPTDSLKERARSQVGKIWAVVDWLNVAERAAAAEPGAVGIPMHLIGEASDKMAAIMAEFCRDEKNANR
jgi:hypothetical protein